jgi:hypothetical protein
VPPARRRDPAALAAAVHAQGEVLRRHGLSADLPADLTPADDLVVLVATGLQAGAPPDRTALRAAVRVLADRFAAAHPGRSVELRIPPFAAVQCVAGPRHTRGTPPNVVETDGPTFIGLTCGFVLWQEAVASGLVRASGDRSDLSAFLPLDERPSSNVGP